MTARQYGLPYMGSKAKIADKIISLLPECEVLVDAFAGGCAITHAALLAGKWSRIIANDISDYPEAFRRAAHGGGPVRWISREEFFTLSDPLLRRAFSFGATARQYFCSREREPREHAAFEAVVHSDVSHLPDAIRESVFRDIAGISTVEGRYYAARRHIRDEFACMRPLCRLLTAGRIAGSAGPRIDRVEFYRRDYRDLRIPTGAVIYCDPPYAGTAGYGLEFNHAAFYDWARSLRRRGHMIFISEYRAPADFRCIQEIPKRCAMSGGCNLIRAEKIFTLD